MCRETCTEPLLREDRLGGVIADGQLRAVGLVVVADDHVSSSSMSAYRRRHDLWWQVAPTLSWLGFERKSARWIAKSSPNCPAVPGLLGSSPDSDAVHTGPIPSLRNIPRQPGRLPENGARGCRSLDPQERVLKEPRGGVHRISGTIQNRTVLA